MTFNDMLKQALQETADERAEQMLNVSPKPRFSLSYKLWEYKTLKNFRQNRVDSGWTVRKARRVVTVMIAAALVLTLTACAVAGMTIGRFSFKDKREYSEMFMASLVSDKTSFEEYYGLPERDGWVRTDYNETPNYTLIGYTHDEKVVAFTQKIIHKNMGNVNTENAVIEPMSIYEKDDGFFIALQGGSDCMLYWIYDGYLFSLNGNLDKNELVNLALSTKIVEF